MVSEVQAAKGYEREDVALTEVLDAIHRKFPPAKLVSALKPQTFNSQTLNPEP